MSAVTRPVAIEWLLEFRRYRELFFFLIWRDVKIRYKQTLLGASWAVIQPFFMMVIFTLMFGRMAGIDSEGVPYPVFSYAALVPWTYFQYAVTLSGNSLVANSKLISKVYFPRAIIPASSSLSGIVDFAIAAVVLIGLMVHYDTPITAGLLLWFVFLVPLVMFATAVGMIFSAMNVKYRDIKYTIPFFLHVMLFVSPIIYPASNVPERYRLILQFNPLVGILDAFRAVVIPSRAIDWNSLAIACSVTVVLFVIASVYFYRTERSFADLV
ncbi:MAG TPA: ABC transporter permease [Candidatus Krumholzibacteria bacterium]|nr:ABC transporter permease [Candidatus Krumholzibacteria bacterium]